MLSEENIKKASLWIWSLESRNAKTGHNFGCSIGIRQAFRSSFFTNYEIM
jgi:hypothetical protein